MIDWLDEHLVPDWRQSWRWWSNQAGLVGLTAATTVAGYPDLLISLTAMLGGTPQLQALVVALTVIIIGLRLWKQEDSDESDKA